MAWYPKATRRKIAKHTSPMAAYRRLILHTAVSAATSQHGWYQQVAHCPHFYLRADGTWEQYVDTQFRAPNQWQGNHDSISVESQDKGDPFPSWSDSDVPPWTDAQVEAIAELAAWLHERHGIPLVRLASSLAGTKGIGWHRQGIDGNFPAAPSILAGRVSGGERWSKARGKVCPGDRRIRQVPGIIARAKQLARTSDWTEELIMSLPKLRLEAKGAVVHRLQGMLLGAGQDLGTYGPRNNGIDGVFGAATELAVRSFQTASALSVNGVVNRATWSKLIQG